MTEQSAPCSLEDEGWVEQLEKDGYVVLRGVLSEEEATHAKNMFWEWLEGLGSGVDRKDHTTWKSANWPGVEELGFFPNHGGGQSKAAWYIRSHPRVKAAFAKVWGTSELITSMDTFIGWRPWWLAVDDSTGRKEHWKPFLEGLHIDQNPKNKPGKHCVQGMVNLYHANDQNGGLQVVPGTNTDEMQQILLKRYPLDWYGDFISLGPSEVEKMSPILLKTQPGDLILWDSRTVHAGKLGEEFDMPLDKVDLPRLSFTVCMTPRSKATNEVIKKRRGAVERGYCLTHWPHEYHPHGTQGSGGWNIPKDAGWGKPTFLTEEMESLIGFEL